MTRVSNWRPKRAIAETNSRSETYDQKVGAQEPRPPTSEAVDESRFRSRIERRAKKVRLPAAELKEWEIWAIVHQIDFQELVADAVRLYMVQAQLCGSPGAQEPSINDRSDDLIDDEETSSLNLFPGSPGAQTGPPVSAKEREDLAFYCDKTRNVLRPRDRDAYHNGNSELPGVSGLPSHQIQYGIMITLLRFRGTKIYTFAYCLGAIHEAAAEGISAEITAMFLRTFDVRMAAKGNPTLNAETVDTASPHYAEYFQNIRRAANQPTLPGAGAELKEGEFTK